MIRPVPLAVLSCVVACILFATAPSAAPYQLVWQDEFDGSALDLSKWDVQIGTGCPSLCGWGNNELQYYRAENATVAGGHLTITAKKESFGGAAYTSARIRTKYLGDWLYGRFEMRARLPVGQGIWPAFWMLPTDSVYGGWPASGEIDIMEYLGQDPDRVFGTIHFGGPESTYTGPDYVLPAGSFADDFHTFALEWEPNEIRWYVDGIQFGCRSTWFSSAARYPAPFDQRFHLLLNMAVGGNLPGAPDASTVFPQEYVIDWVRVWQRTEDFCCILFDGMDHANPFGNGWFVFNGGGGGGIGANTTDLPPQEACGASLESGWGGPAGYIGGFGRTFPIDLSGMTHFEFWLNPDAGQSYTLEINLQDDDNGDDLVPGMPNGLDDEFQYNLIVSPTGPGAIAGGGWQKISIPLADFFDDNSYHWGGNGIFDPIPTAEGGNGQLTGVVVTIISPSGGTQTFRTDYWNFRNANAVAAPDPTLTASTLSFRGGHPNPFGSTADIRFELPRAAHVSLLVYDVRGRLVRRLVDQTLDAGPHAVQWNGKGDAGGSVASGVYFLRLETAGSAQTQKIVLQR